jgi:hypothetical protein
MLIAGRTAYSNVRFLALDYLRYVDPFHSSRLILPVDMRLAGFPWPWSACDVRVSRRFDNSEKSTYCLCSRDDLASRSK